MKSLRQRVDRIEGSISAYLANASIEELERIQGKSCMGIKWEDFTDAELDELTEEIESGGNGDILLSKVRARLEGA
jgi:hypothetical protein